jgi:DNA adenine methylase
MRFNGSGRFNVPFCHKPGRFSQAYITKIVNQVRAFSTVVQGRDWQFEVADFRETLLRARQGDFVYVDPPYAGRHVDYFNSWDDEDEADLVRALKALPCNFLLSTWHGNRYRQNAAIQANWATPDFTAAIFEHFYHVGATEDLRNAMTEALIANYPLPEVRQRARQKAEDANVEVHQYALW